MIVLKYNFLRVSFLKLIRDTGNMKDYLAHNLLN